MRMIFWVVLIAAVAVLAYFRLAPSDPQRWHVAIEASENADGPGSSTRVLAAEPEILARADAHMRMLPRTQVLAGSVEEGHITYITRSRVFGFPDYTTVQYAPDEGLFKAYGRLRFGQSDMGVNRDRLERLIAGLQG